MQSGWMRRPFHRIHSPVDLKPSGSVRTIPPRVSRLPVSEVQEIACHMNGARPKHPRTTHHTGRPRLEYHPSNTSARFLTGPREAVVVEVVLRMKWMRVNEREHQGRRRIKRVDRLQRRPPTSGTNGRPMRLNGCTIVIRGPARRG